MKTNCIAYPNLRAEMGRKNISIQEMAKLCGFTRDSLSRKLSRKAKLGLDEAFGIQQRIFPEFDVKYLFSAEDAVKNQRDRPA